MTDKKDVNELERGSGWRPPSLAHCLPFVLTFCVGDTINTLRKLPHISIFTAALSRVNSQVTSQAPRNVKHL